MHVITFANPKGGTGKTTCALLLASTLATQGVDVAIVDADPERWISQWAALPGKPDNIQIFGNAFEYSIIDRIDEAKSQAQCVLVDLEGTASMLVAHAVSRSDLVLIPTQGASMDARGAGRLISLIRNQERWSSKKIRYAVVQTRTNAAITTRAMRNVREQLVEAGIPLIPTPIVERAAYRDVIDYGGLLEDLDRSLTSNLDQAIDNAVAYTRDVLTMLLSPSLPLDPMHEMT